MGMVHYTSGRRNLTYEELIKSNATKPSKSFIPKSLLKLMLIRENELRISDEYQKRFHEAEQTSSSTSWLDVADELQREVIREFHLDEEMNDALLCLRCATQIYPDLKDIPLYTKYNRARDGDLQVGDIAPNVPVIHLDEQENQLFDGLKSSPTVLITHAQDEWPISSARWSPAQMPIKYNQTRTIQER
ncbi:unnamed protein product, partial [Adineta steineri]